MALQKRTRYEIKAFISKYMEIRNEKWESLRLEAQSFAPQEYIAGCYRWELTLDCRGGSKNEFYYVFESLDGTEVGHVDHAAHSETYYAVTDTNEPPSGQELLDVLNSIGEFPGLQADTEATNGNPRKVMRKAVAGEDYVWGHAWITTDGEMHFIEGDMVWHLIGSGTGSGPNAS